MIISKELRQEIIKDYAERHDGVYDAKGFFEEVRDIGPDHPAYKWFTWDSEKAAFEYNVDEARRFARNLKVVFQIKNVHSGNVTIKTPFAHSPIASRRSGGGYRVTDLSNDEHYAELKRQAQAALVT